MLREMLAEEKRSSDYLEVAAGSFWSFLATSRPQSPSPTLELRERVRHLSLSTPVAELLRLPEDELVAARNHFSVSPWAVAPPLAVVVGLGAASVVALRRSRGRTAATLSLQRLVLRAVLGTGAAFSLLGLSVWFSLRRFAVFERLGRLAVIEEELLQRHLRADPASRRAVLEAVMGYFNLPAEQVERAVALSAQINGGRLGST